MYEVPHEIDNRSRISRSPLGYFLICEVTATQNPDLRSCRVSYRTRPGYSHPPLSKS